MTRPIRTRALRGAAVGDRQLVLAQVVGAHRDQAADTVGFLRDFDPGNLEY